NQRDAPALDSDARYDSCCYAGIVDLRRRSDSSVRVGDGVRYLYRNVQLHLYRWPDSPLDREKVAEEDRNIQGFIDSHAHLADEAFAGDRDAVIQRAKESGAEAIVCIGSGSGAGDVLGAARASAIVASENPGYVWSTAGVHPHDAAGFDPRRDIDDLRSLVARGAIAIGECGLDYH